MEICEQILLCKDLKHELKLTNQDVAIRIFKTVVAGERYKNIQSRKIDTNAKEHYRFVYHSDIASVMLDSFSMELCLIVE